MKSLAKIITYFIVGLCRLALVVIGAIVFFGSWFWPVYYYFEEENLFTEIWISTFAFIVFYGLAMWHVVSEDEREVSVWIKMKRGILVSFNKMLFAFVVFFIYIIVLGTVNGEL